MKADEIALLSRTVRNSFPSFTTYVSPFDLAIMHCGLGEPDAMFECLEDAFRQRVFRLVELTLPMFDNLRSDSRWQIWRGESALANENFRSGLSARILLTGHSGTLVLQL